MTTINESPKLHVVLADDDTDDSFIFNAAVEQAKLPVSLTITENGLELLNYLDSEKHPDIIFLDINMPLTNGIECLQTIRSNNKFNHVPVVMYSTTNNKQNVEACYNAGANLFIVKPNTFEEINKMVRTICSADWVTNSHVPPKEEFIQYSFL